MGMGMEMPERRGADISARLLGLAARAINVARGLPRDTTGRHIAAQIVRCGTSGGANYEEARAAESRADFIHKIGVASKEVRKTIFWLQLVKKCELFEGPLEDAIAEADELVAILVSSARTARSNAKSP